jgi:general secretion pathway protein F
VTGTVFTYQAVDGSGRRLKGVETAASQGALTQTLESRGLMVLDVGPSEGTAKQALGGMGRFSRRRDVLEVTRALAALLPAGLPLARALAAASEIAPGSVAQALEAVRAKVERGERLATALEEHPALFPPLYVGLVRAGERGGDLAGAFSRLAYQLEREDELRGKLLSASIYPLVLAAAGGVAVVVLLTAVIPRFVDLLQGTGATLPRSTAALLGVSAAARRFWPLWLALPAVLILGIAWARTTEEGRRAGAALLLKLPPVGTLRRNALGARFARLVGVLLAGGAPLLSALDDTLECLGDPLARDEIARIRARVREGAALNAAIGEGTLFPPLLTQLVAVGEGSSRIQEFLLKAAEILEHRTARAVERLVALAEPAMIVVFGGLVGFVALSLLQAIYSVNAGSLR